MKGFLIFIQLLLLIAGYAVFLNQWVSPNIFPYFNLLSLGFLLLFIANLILLFIWWLYRWKLAILFTLLSIPLLITLNKTYHIYGEPETNHSNLKLITYNVRYFNDESQNFSEFFKGQDADFIFFQEMGKHPDWILKNSSSGKPYYFENTGAMSIASKYPILRGELVNFNSEVPNVYSYVDVKVKNDTLRLISIYLESLRLDQEKIKSSLKNAKFKDEGISLIDKVNKASNTHYKQILELRKFIVNSPYSVIVAGDMNAVPSSYEYYAISRGLKDAFLLGGKGLGSTFPGFKYPLRLDYVFVSPEIKVKSYQVKKVNYSDHYPVIVELEIPQ